MRASELVDVRKKSADGMPVVLMQAAELVGVQNGKERKRQPPEIANFFIFRIEILLVFFSVGGILIHISDPA